MKIKEKCFLFIWLHLNQSLAACQHSVGISALSDFEPEQIFEHTRYITFKKRGEINRKQKKQ